MQHANEKQPIPNRQRKAENTTNKSNKNQNENEKKNANCAASILAKCVMTVDSNSVSTTFNLYIFKKYQCLQ